MRVNAMRTGTGWPSRSLPCNRAISAVARQSAEHRGRCRPVSHTKGRRRRPASACAHLSLRTGSAAAICIGALTARPVGSPATSVCPPDRGAAEIRGRGLRRRTFRSGRRAGHCLPAAPRRAAGEPVDSRRPPSAQLPARKPGDESILGGHRPASLPKVRHSHELDGSDIGGRSACGGATLLPHKPSIGERSTYFCRETISHSQPVPRSSGPLAKIPLAKALIN